MAPPESEVFGATFECEFMMTLYTQFRDRSSFIHIESAKRTNKTFKMTFYYCDFLAQENILLVLFGF